MTDHAAHEQALDRDCLTLSRHVLQQLQSFDAAAQDLSALMNRIALAGKLIARRLSRAGLMEGVLGFTGAVNIQGEDVKKMDVYANEVFIAAFKQSGLVCRLASEEMEKPYYIPENCPIGRYTLLYDPLDGSSNVDINLNVGSIFAIRQQEGTDLDGTAADLLQDGHKQIAAGYILYGPSTMLVYSLGRGTHVFVLDPSLGEFILAIENLQIPASGPIYSVNEGNFWAWEESIRNYVRHVHRQPGYSARYSGALVGDIHRILMQGGSFSIRAPKKIRRGSCVYSTKRHRSPSSWNRPVAKPVPAPNPSSMSCLIICTCAHHSLLAALRTLPLWNPLFSLPLPTQL